MISSDELRNSTEAVRDLPQRVEACLHQHGYWPHKALEINAERGVVLVQGLVPTFYLQQIAVECTKRVAGVAQGIDLIEVLDSPVQSQATDSPVEKQESPAVLNRHSVDFPTLTRTVQDTLRSLVRNRHPLSSAKG